WFRGSAYCTILFFSILPFFSLPYITKAIAKKSTTYDAIWFQAYDRKSRRLINASNAEPDRGGFRASGNFAVAPRWPHT
ncbi:hypothetical protein M513_01993, partial [Trichuris suis]